jgi:hypothetical protein
MLAKGFRFSQCQALANRGPAECPGFHVELSGWRHYWRLPEALEAMYGPKQAA